MTEKEKAAVWIDCWKNVAPKYLSYHMTACLEHDGERVLNEAFKLMGIKTPADFVRRAQK